MFVDHDVLTHVIVGHKPAVNHVATVAVPPLPAPEMQVSYLPCPVCTNRMNRAIFGRKSGVVIDVCKMHGSWFDVRELTGCIAFIEQGGLERAEKQALEEKRDAIRRARIERRTDAMTEALHAPASRFDMGPESVHPDVLIDLLQVLLGS